MMFVVNEVIPEGMLALVTVVDDLRETIWYGLVTEVPTNDFERSDEAHVGPETYARIAAHAEATGKGRKLH
ncbi:MAG: hypothetical protein H0T76_20225 [Nannocystis sp.]|nr:hypothetical protein [Nannocystis sp.]